MFKNYFKIAFRTLRRHTGYAFINIFGLAVGMACCVLILLFVRSELSYDRYHENADRIYRVVRETTSEDGITKSARSQVPMGPTLKTEFPEVEEVVRFWRGFQPVLRHEDTVFRESGLYFADPGVFEVFSFDFRAGDPQTALTTPGSVVLAASLARKYFGDEEPMGETFAYDGYPAGSLDLTVTGVLDDLPSNTHLAFEALVSLEGVETERDNFGSSKPIWTYVLLPEGTPPERLESKLPDFVDRHLSSPTYSSVMHLEPITDLHLYTGYEGGFKPKSDIAYLYLFGAIGFFILLLACINFINLSTARSLKRAREVGMRKVLGAYRGQLVGQFLGEAFLFCGLALVLALLLVEAMLPVFNNLFGQALTLSYLYDGFLLWALPALLFVVGGVSGLYPALFLSRFQPTTALKGRFLSSAAGAPLRKSLVVFQFAISVVLIIGTLTVYQQLSYLSQKNLGFDKEQVVVMPYSPQEDVLRETLLQHPEVLSVSVSQRVPVNTINGDGRPVLPDGFEENVSVESYIIDDTFLETYGMTLLAGRNLSSELASDSSAFLINEAAVRRFGWGSLQEALGKNILWSNGPTEGPVVGVVQDFHLGSMHEEIPPLVFHMRSGEQWWRTFISAKIRPGDVSGTLAFLEETWRMHTPDGAYDYFFIDDSFEQLHRADARFGTIIGYFAGLAILIACLGLFGLAAFTAEQRTKEVGVRKVLGASVPGVVLLLSKDFARLVLVALVVAGPVAYFAMSRWLDDFAYRVDLGVGTFVLAGGLALLIAVLTVSYQAIKAALADPVKSLRYE